MAQPLEKPELWAAVGGLPPGHLIQAALEVARWLDAHGAPVQDARHTYIRQPTGGIYPPDDLRRAERLLVEAGLVREQDETLYPLPELTTLAFLDDDIAHETLLSHCLLAAPPPWLNQEPLVIPPEAVPVLDALLPDAERREAFLIALGRRVQPEALEALGAVGEDCVTAAARAELEELGREDLAAAVRRVSLLSDQLGYDVVAPGPDDKTRRLEVKCSGRRADGLARFFLSRNEGEVGRRDPDWALVYCQVDAATGAGAEDVEIVGWCRARNLESYLPTDAPGGRWRTVEITMPLTALFDGLPPAV
ncbi:MAG: DUF3883 domain-containing protein [Actinobacteria bacterium]|nr:MAG: DUF3883 domain-containing protein [Actinomycetota bacterium]